MLRAPVLLCGTGSVLNPGFCTRKMASSLSSPTGMVTMAEVKRFITDTMAAAGAPRKKAGVLAEALLSADYRGHYSHGLNRLEMYVQDVQAGSCDPAAEPQLLKETPATGWVEGNKGLGPVVGHFCMQLAIRKAREAGVGWVAAKGSNHYGIAGWYSMMALEHEMMGLSFTNTSPLMSPTRSKQAALGTNPISLAIPAGADCAVLDMATTAAALGKIEMQQRRREAIPLGWAQDPDGRPTSDPDIAYRTAALMPLGGAEITAGYKGYGLALLVEAFCGLLSGSAYGPNVRKWGNCADVADLGQCFIAVDPAAFAPGFQDRARDLLASLRSMAPADPSLPVLVPGDPERAHMAKVDQRGGISYIAQQLISLEKLANKLNITPMRLTTAS